MDHRIVRKLEDELEKAIAAVFETTDREELPLDPHGPTVHLMAKAAVTVYEAAVENQRPKSVAKRKPH
ncbi:MAG: hypothetical protein KDA96_18325 [Planctomycetaceae bacterium]|nr:hypothetical protein [Planctomycetaceae bacterium]